MPISAFDLFKIGIGPSSSHTGGPMKAAFLYTELVAQRGLVDSVHRVEVELFGSLGVTGHGHGTIKAVILGLEGEQPHLVDPVAAGPRVDEVAANPPPAFRGPPGDRFRPGGRPDHAPPEAARLPHQRDAVSRLRRRRRRAPREGLFFRGRWLRPR